MSKKRRLVTPSGGSPDDKGSDTDAQPKLKASAATAKGTAGRNARTKGNAKDKAEAEAKATEKQEDLDRDRNLSVGPPFRLRHRIKGDTTLCALIGKFSSGSWPIVGTSIHASSNFEKIMTTILEEANAGAFTTKGQAIDRRNELVDIERRTTVLAYLKRPVFLKCGAATA